MSSLYYSEIYSKAMTNAKRMRMRRPSGSGSTRLDDEQKKAAHLPAAELNVVCLVVGRPEAGAMSARPWARSS